MWMPRLSAAYKLGEKTVLKAGYGIYYDTLNAADYNHEQPGLQLDDDQHQQHGLRPDLPARQSVRGPCWGSPIRSRSGLTGPASTSRPDRRSASTRSPARATRSRTRTTSTRASSGGGSAIQRELARNLSVEVAYDGSYSDRIEVSIRQDYLPQQYWIPGSLNARDTAAQTLLTANVTNPYAIANFAALRTTDPVLLSADVRPTRSSRRRRCSGIACCGRSRTSTT